MNGGARASDAPPYDALVRAWKALRATHDLTVREVACVGSPRTLLIAEIARAGRPVVCLSAGVHGDEPAAPWALLTLARDGLLDTAYGYRIWPCTNPTGYERGTRENADGQDINRGFSRGGTTPEAKAVVTANRDRRFALFLDMHEDFEADGFYCYEPPVDGHAPLGARVVAEVEAAGFPIQELHDAFELGYTPDAHHVRRLERGRVLPDAAAEFALPTGLAHSMYLLKRRAAGRTLTIESPRRLAWNDRLAIHRTAVVAALERLTALEATAS